MIGTKYLSEVINVDTLEIKKLNIIKAPTGCGKTYFALHDIASRCNDTIHQAVYLIDTINGKEQILKNYGAVECTKNWIQDIKDDRMWFHEDKRIVIMTYSKFGTILTRNPDFHNNFDYIICDELHSLIKFQHFSQLPNSHSIAREGLERAVANERTKVIALSATPNQVKEHFHTSYYELPIPDDVRHYETRRIERYTNLFYQLASIHATDKVGICYVSHITMMIKLQEIAIKQKYSPVCIWSTSNTDHPMTEEQLAVREEILNNFTIPEQYNLLIINASCETSIKIESHVDYMIVNNSNEDTQVQVRGRYTGDLENLYLPSNKLTDIKVPEQFLGKQLFKDDKQELCRVLNIHNEKNRLCRWNTIHRLLLDLNYQVTEGRSNNRRYSIITLAPIYKDEVIK